MAKESMSKKDVKQSTLEGILQDGQSNDDMLMPSPLLGGLKKAESMGVTFQQQMLGMIGSHNEVSPFNEEPPRQNTP